MRNIVLFAHISLDGFVAGSKGELDGFPVGDENLKFVCDLTEQADAALFGRLSYQLLDSYWPTAKDRVNASKNEIAYSNWYNSATKIVISKTITQEKLNNTVVIGGNFPHEITKLKELPGKDILIFGSPSVSKVLMQLGLIDSYWIFVNPVIFSEGIPLFGGLSKKIKLKLEATKQFPNGEIALNYLPDNQQ